MTRSRPVEGLIDFQPLAERALAADADAFLRLRRDDDRIGGFVLLPYDVIVGRTIAQPAANRSDPSGDPADVTYRVRDFLDWLSGAATEPARRDAHWLSALPPRQGWTRIDFVPDDAIRNLVRTGADLARDVSARAAQQALLSAAVLTVTGAKAVDVPLRALAAVTSMGFLPRESRAAIDVAPGWIRVTATYGSTYVTDGSSPFSLLTA